MTKGLSVTFVGNNVKAVVPKGLIEAVLKIQAEEGVDFERACILAAERIDSGSEKFHKSVRDAVRRRSNSIILSQVNKARVTIKSKGYGNGLAAGRSRGYSEGYERGKGDHQVWYLCNTCDGRLNISPNSAAHKAMIELMKDAGWGHSSCHQ